MYLSRCKCNNPSPSRLYSHLDFRSCYWSRRARSEELEWVRSGWIRPRHVSFPTHTRLIHHGTCICQSGHISWHFTHSKSTAGQASACPVQRRWRRRAGRALPPSRNLGHHPHLSTFTVAPSYGRSGKLAADQSPARRGSLGRVRSLAPLAHEVLDVVLDFDGLVLLAVPGREQEGERTEVGADGTFMSGRCHSLELTLNHAQLT